MNVYSQVLSTEREEGLTILKQQAKANKKLKLLLVKSSSSCAIVLEPNNDFEVDVKDLWSNLTL